MARGWEESGVSEKMRGIVVGDSVRQSSYQYRIWSE